MAVDIFGLIFFCFVGSISQTSGEFLLHTVLGEVGRGNYTYYSLMNDGPIVLYLRTRSGDADLYVSQLVTRPTYEPENHCLQSTTCGLDVVHIPASFQRPVGIGVYGHVSHELSQYLLEVYYREEDQEDNSETETDIENEIGTAEESSRENKDSAEGESEEPEVDEDDEGESFIWTVILSVIDILLEVVFL